MEQFLLCTAQNAQAIATWLGGEVGSPSRKAGKPGSKAWFAICMSKQVQEKDAPGNAVERQQLRNSVQEPVQRGRQGLRGERGEGAT